MTWIDEPPPTTEREINEALREAEILIRHGTTVRAIIAETGLPRVQIMKLRAEILGPEGGKDEDPRSLLKQITLPRADWLLAKYGLTVEKYTALSKKQGDVCAICGRLNRNLPLYVDHDHTTGQIRGLLCDGCNYGLGCFKDNIAVLEQAKQYMLSYLRFQLEGISGQPVAQGVCDASEKSHS